MMLWTMTICLRLVALEMAWDCEAAEVDTKGHGVISETDFTIAGESAAVYQCVTDTCVKNVRKLAVDKYQVVELPRHKAFILLPLVLWQKAFAEYVTWAPLLDRVQ